MKNKLEVSRNKSLKLTNVIVKTLEESDFENFAKEVTKMESYIKTKGSMPLGPLIQYTNGYVSENGEVGVKVSLMRQSSNYLNNIEVPYKMESVLSIKSCIYVRYTGDESKIEFAYDKLNLLAFEENIQLKGDCYTIIVNQEDDHIVADVFMEKSKVDR